MSTEVSLPAAPTDSTPHDEWAPIPGPVDRESFYAAQLRNRRATWRLTALCALAVLVMGIPLSAVLSPLLYGLTFLGLDVANLVHPMPDPIEYLHRLDQESSRPGSGIDSETIPPGTWLLAAAVLVPPGMLALLLAWLAVRTAFLRAGTGGLLLGLGARDPRPGDLEEQQLRNIVEEMAIAAGVPPPRLLLLDVEAPNAAAVGSSIEDSALIVTRPLLDQLDRAETQALIGHLVASVGNGDLRNATTMLSLFQTYGLVATLLQSPYGAESRRVVWRLIRFAFRRKKGDGFSDTEAEELASRLILALDPNESTDLDKFDKRSKVMQVLSLPFLMAYMSFWMTQQVVGALLVGPLIALTWRTRRYLADATAVQLTRDPEALSRALTRLGQKTTAFPAAAWASHLFAVWWGGTSKGTLGDRVAMHMSLQPPLPRRLRRLGRMGAAVPEGALKRPVRPLVALGWTLFSPVIALLVGLMLVVAGGCVMISLAIDGMFFLGLFVMPLHFLLRALS
jgi:Zn-dependent protease with chaperone function